MRTLNRGSSVRDERNRLIYDFLRFARVLRPKSIMLENVPGLGEGNRIKRFCDALTRLGYNWEQRVVNAADYGVPQRRRRFLLLASRVGAVALPTPTAQASTVREAIGDLPVPKKSDDTLHNLPEQRAPHVRALIRQIPKNGGSRSSLPKSLQLDCHIRSNGFYDVYGRMSWDDVAPTITSGCTNPSKGRFLHPTQNRAITLREAALLQTFPTSYFFSLKRGKEHVAAMIGNALPPRMIKAFATTVRGKVLRRPRRRGKVSRSNGIKAHGAT
jgi:DNA (cytosine-5)-methyltransferase 1